MKKATGRKKEKVQTDITMIQATMAAQSYASLVNEQQELEAKMNEEIDKIKESYNFNFTRIEQEQAANFATLKTFAAENKATWGIKKSTNLLYCLVGFRTGNRQVNKPAKNTWQDIIKVMQQNRKLKPFVRNVPEVNKEAILAAKNETLLAMLKTECGVTVGQAETFFVEPQKVEVSTAPGTVAVA